MSYDQLMPNVCTCRPKNHNATNCESPPDSCFNKYCSATLVKYTESFLEHSYRWLNNKEIKRLTNTPDLNREGQKKWYESIKERTDYKIWGINFDSRHIGACGLKNITNEDCEYWGYIGEKRHWGKGLGSCILFRLINYAKNSNMSSIWLKVLKENQRAINLYSKFGFKQEEELESGIIKMRLQFKKN